MVDELEKIAEDAKEAAVNEDEPSNEYAPISPYADEPSKEEVKEMKQKKDKESFINAIKEVSSTSEAEMSGNEAAKAKKVLAKDQLVPKKQDSTPQKVIQICHFKGHQVAIESDVEEVKSPKKKKEVQESMLINYDKHTASDASSQASIDDYLQQQRRKIRGDTNPIQKVIQPKFVPKSRVIDPPSDESSNSETEAQ